MTYEDITKTLAREGFFTFYRKDTGTLVCSSGKWPNMPNRAHSFWVVQRRDNWYLGTWAPHLYLFSDPSCVPAFCITWLRQHPTQAQGGLDEHVRQKFRLMKLNPDDLPAANV